MQKNRERERKKTDESTYRQRHILAYENDALNGVFEIERATKKRMWIVKICIQRNHCKCLTIKIFALEMEKRCEIKSIHKHTLHVKSEWERETLHPYSIVIASLRLSIKLFCHAAFSEQCTTYKASFVRVNVIISILLWCYCWNGFVYSILRERQQWTFVVMIFLKSLELLLFANSSLPALVQNPFWNGITLCVAAQWHKSCLFLILAFHAKPFISLLAE